MYSGKNIDWDEYDKLYNECEGGLVLVLNNVKDCLLAAEKEYPFYYGFPVSTYEEFNSLVELDPYYIIPGSSLFFNLEYICSKEIPLKIFPNICSMSLFPKVRPETGTWVRPEDIDYYSKYIECCEFITETLEQERALFRIYKKEKEFIGPINLIIPELKGFNADNDLINPEFIPIRTYCQQKCESGERNCYICRDILKLADEDKLKYLLDQDRLQFMIENF